MSHFAGHKPRSSSLAVARRTTVASVLAAVMLLAYSLLPRQSFGRIRPFREGLSSMQQTSELPSEPVGDVPQAESVSQPQPHSPQGCLRSIVYDKPVKTASTAITYAIRLHLRSSGRVDLPCNMLGDSCAQQIERVCLGTHKRMEDEPSFLGHLKHTNGSTIECLKRMGYYAVTSIRHPYERRKSAYLYNKTMKGQHYGISYTVSFKEFMQRLPKCVLFHDYDNLGRDCDAGIPLEERVKRIVDRYDEVIELGEEARGPLFKKIERLVARENESRKEDVSEDIDEEDYKEEKMLYDALKAKMLRAEVTDRVPC